ncbi:TKL/DRK protein kinase [Phytophthora nicotianae P1569]|uniref:TKL/DRK protein kinase n=1 Tax=Phytophthora nicotianae P1569 TaxID=1317065 RepID=V9FVS3_PHYNI|nr:TKL/DRK protein kinase [Phytophthora nicotianae P1569]
MRSGLPPSDASSSPSSLVSPSIVYQFMALSSELLHALLHCVVAFSQSFLLSLNSNDRQTGKSAIARIMDTPTRESKHGLLAKQGNFACLEDDGSRNVNGQYECQQTPVASNNKATSKHQHKRPGSKVNLWDDDVITTARIPKDKIIMENLISQGGYGEVYKGTFNGLSVAVKRMLPAHRKSVAHVNNFLAEVKLMASLDHSRIVQFVGVAWDALSDVCAVIEFMDGGDLRGLLTSYHNHHHPVGFDCDKVKIALHVAHALTYLHSLSPVVIHRDLKSRNILLTSDLDAKLTDFGVSRERVDHTMTAGVGTSLWMAPEVLMGERYDDKADIFSFGVVLSELDLQVLPYSHATDSDGSGHRMRDLAILQRMAMGKLRVQFSCDALASMVDLGNACVSLAPKDRPTAAEVLYRLQTIQRDERLPAST